AGAILAAQCFAVIAKGSFGFQGVLYIFSACCFLGLLFSFWVPETKGLTLEELSGDNNEKDLVEDYQENKTPAAHV
ncbi:unnamed protein product, partial [Aphanomyces euteiches]